MPSWTRTKAPNGTSLVTRPGHDLTDLVGARELLPRVFLGRLQRQRDPLAVHVDVEHLDGDLLADLDDLGRVVDVLPRQLGDVDETVDAAEVDEGTEVDDRGDDTAADLALLQLGQEVLANRRLGLLEPGTAGEHDVVAVLVELDDLGLDLLAHVGLEVADAAHLDERGREEAAQADVEDETTLDDLDDRALDDAVSLFDLLDGAPGPLVLGALLGQDQPTVLVLLLEDESLDGVTDGDDLGGVDVVLDRQLAGGDDALGLVPDVEQDLVAVDLDDRPLDDVTVVEVLDGLVDSGEERLFRPDVVDRDLEARGGRLVDRGGGGYLGATRHGLGDSVRTVGRDRARGGPISRAEPPGSVRPTQVEDDMVRARACSVRGRAGPQRSGSLRWPP